MEDQKMLVRSAVLAVLTLLPDLLVLVTGYLLVQSDLKSTVFQAVAFVVLIMNYGLPLLLLRFSGLPIGGLLISGMTLLRLLHAIATGSSMARWERRMGLRRAALLAYSLFGILSFVAAAVAWFTMPSFGPP